MWQAIIFDSFGVLAREGALPFDNQYPDANHELFNYIKTSLKPHYKIGVLSNSAANWLNMLFAPEQRALFDATALSYETGFIKPDRRAYEIIAKRLEVDLRSCIYVDDNPEHCQAAAECGMAAIVYSSLAQLKTDIERLLRTSSA